MKSTYDQPLQPTDVVGFLRRLPLRVRERHFWLVQVLMLAVTILHIGMEVSDFGPEGSGLHFVPVMLYGIGIVVAGIRYGPEGGILTGIWATVMAVPNIVIWHRHDYAWVTETIQLLAALGVGAVVSWQVELHTAQRKIAEANSRRLSLLNQVSAALNQTLDLEDVLDATLAQVARSVDSDHAWIVAWDEATGEPSLLAHVGEAHYRCSQSHVQEGWLEPFRVAQRDETPIIIKEQALAFPLAAKGNLLGVLVVSYPAAASWSQEDMGLLAAMANQIAGAIDKSRLRREEIRMQQALREYARQITQAYEVERQRISRELHDDSIQSLVLLSRQLDDLSKRPGASLDDVRQLAYETVQSLRRFSRDLRPSILDDLGLIAAIDWLVTDLSKRTSIKASLDVRGTSRRLDPDSELALFRIVQESIRNAEKHSQADSLVVTAEFAEDRLNLTIVDDGRGFEVKPLKDGVYTGKLGLLGMRERANLLGAFFDIQSRPGEGTKVTIALSYARDQTVGEHSAGEIDAVTR